MNKRKVLSVERKVTVIRQIESGEKIADVCWEFGLVSYTTQMMREKTEPNLLVRLNGTDRE